MGDKRGDNVTRDRRRETGDGRWEEMVDKKWEIRDIRLPPFNDPSNNRDRLIKFWLKIHDERMLSLELELMNNDNNCLFLVHYHASRYTNIKYLYE